MTIKSVTMPFVSAASITFVPFATAAWSPFPAFFAAAGVLGLILLSPMLWLVAEGLGHSKWGIVVVVVFSVALMCGGLTQLYR